MARKKLPPQRWLWLDVLLGIAVLFLIFFFWDYIQKQNTLPKTWQWQDLWKYFLWQDEEGWHLGLFIHGLIATLKVGFWAGFLALCVGLCLGTYLATKSRGLMPYFLSSLVIFLRNTPPLVLLFLLYFLTSENTLAFMGNLLRAAPSWVQSCVAVIFATPNTLDRMLAAVLTLGLYQGAYVAEIIRSGLQSLPQGQWDAGAALGFSRHQQLFAVLLPQALPIMLPPLAGQYVSIFKDSALASLISVPELTFQGMEIVAITRLPFETWICILLLYLIISLVCTRTFAYAERRLQWYKKT